MWKDGDTISLKLPMEIQQVKGIDRIEATRGQVALTYGPLVYCVEQVDQDLDGALPENPELKTEWESDLLGGILAIKGTWSDNSPLLAIPYYARDNRQPEATDGAEEAGGPGTTDQSQRRRRGRGINSMVWIQQP
jgi:DUF1680 family protein